MVVTKHPRRGRPEKRLLLFTGTRFCILKKAAEKVTHKTKGWSVGDKGWRGVARGSDSEVRHCSPVVCLPLSVCVSQCVCLSFVSEVCECVSPLTISLSVSLSMVIPQVFHTTSKKYKLELDGDCCLVASLQVIVYRWYSV